MNIKYYTKINFMVEELTSYKKLQLVQIIDDFKSYKLS